MCASLLDLNDDVLGEIFRWVAADYESTATWFLTCRQFQRMVSRALIRTYTFPTFKRHIHLYDGWQNGFATFRGKEVYFAVSQDREVLKPCDYPKEVWDKLLFESTIEGEDVETREYIVHYFDYADGGLAAFYVRCKRQYKLYKEWPHPYPRTFEQLPEEDCVGEFTEDEFLIIK